MAKAKPSPSSWVGAIRPVSPAPHEFLESSVERLIRLSGDFSPREQALQAVCTFDFPSGQSPVGCFLKLENVAAVHDSGQFTAVMWWKIREPGRPPPFRPAGTGLPLSRKCLLQKLR
jgi:hypothetical protein